MANEALELLKRIRELLKDVKPEHIKWDSLAAEMDTVIAKAETASKPRKGKKAAKPVVKPKKGVKKESHPKAIVEKEIDFFEGLQ